jgi:hypothetical protein
MRSITLHLAGTSQKEIEPHLSHWQTSKSLGDNLYVDLYETRTEQMNVARLEEFQRVLGGLPDVSLVADVSGRVDGEAEIFAFVQYFLNRYSGLAMDDYTNHGWVLNEIINGASIQGHPFFDYLGWNEGLHSKPKNS